VNAREREAVLAKYMVCDRDVCPAPGCSAALPADDHRIEITPAGPLIHCPTTAALRIAYYGRKADDLVNEETWPYFCEHPDGPVPECPCNWCGCRVWGSCPEYVDEDD
jgi:hypothetical protein